MICQACGNEKTDTRTRFVPAARGFAGGNSNICDQCNDRREAIDGPGKRSTAPRGQKGGRA